MLDLNARGTYPRVGSPECGLETVALMAPIQHCRVAEVPGGGGAGWWRCRLKRSRKCAVVRGCTGNGHSPGETQDKRKVGVSPGEMESAEDSGYIRPDSVVESPVYVWSVTGSLLFGSSLRRARGLRQPPLPSQDPSWIVLVGFWFRAAIVKVMSVPDSRCVRVVTPDDHVNISFHEILIHDLEDEELPFVTLSELGCLRFGLAEDFVYVHV